MTDTSTDSGFNSYGRTTSVENSIKTNLPRPLKTHDTLDKPFFRMIMHFEVNTNQHITNFILSRSPKEEREYNLQIINLDIYR